MLQLKGTKQKWTVPLTLMILLLLPSPHHNSPKITEILILRTVITKESTMLGISRSKFKFWLLQLVVVWH